MFNRVVVAIDADGGADAVRLALHLASPDAVMILAGAHWPEHADSHGDHPFGVASAAALHGLKQARAVLRRPCELVAEADVDPVAAVHRVAEREDADLLVLGAHRAGGLAIARFVHGAPCAVAVAGAGQMTAGAGFDSVGVACRSTEEGRNAPRAAAAVAAQHEATLHAIHVVSPELSPWLGPAVNTVHTLSLLDGTLVRTAREQLGKVAPGVQIHVPVGDPVALLVDFSERVDLLVVETEPTGTIRRLVMGSTVDALTQQVRSALLIVGAAPDADDRVGVEAGSVPAS